MGIERAPSVSRRKLGILGALFGIAAIVIVITGIRDVQRGPGVRNITDGGAIYRLESLKGKRCCREVKPQLMSRLTARSPLGVREKTVPF
jgi:hypothetical protein